MVKRWITQLLSLFGVKLRWPVKPKRDKYEVVQECVKRAMYWKGLIDSDYNQAQALISSGKFTERDLEKIKRLETNVRRRTNHLRRIMEVQRRAFHS